MVNCTLCKWCFKPIDGRDEEVVITNNFEVLHTYCYNEYNKAIKTPDEEEDIRESSNGRT